MLPARTRDLTRALLLVLSVLAAIPLAAQGPDPGPGATPWPTQAWSRAAPEAVGLAAAPLESLIDAAREGRLGWVDRLVVVRHGRLVVSERFERDYVSISRGQRGPLGCGTDACESSAEVHDYNYLHPDVHPYYRGRDVHSLQSITKSVSATVIGAAIHRGEIESVDEPLLAFFGDYDLSGVDPRLQDARLHHLLTMRTGIEWHESDRPLDDTNTTLLLERSDDWIQFTLDQPMDAAPGEKWVYNSGGSHLMSGVVRQATGRFIDEYAEEVLFGPLGIDDYAWKVTPKGYPDTEGGLFLDAEDLAKIGLLYLEDGVWDGERILPEGWVASATARQVEVGDAQGRGYGYQWWRVDVAGVEVWAGLGFGDQFLFVLPEYDLIGVANSWNLFEAPAATGSIYRGLLTALIESAGAG